MAKLGVPLCVHGEVVDASVDPFDREREFLTRELSPLLDEVPDLKVILEHVTTEEAVKFVESKGMNVAATITPQHLLYDRSHLFSGGLRPHFYCLPILKRGNPHRLALLRAIASGSPKFFLGTDSAPHAQSEKEKDCGCAGCFTAYSAIELYLEAFEEADALEHFENFACKNGAAFYGIEPNKSKMRLICEKKPMKIPRFFSLDLAKGDADARLVPLRAGEQCEWTTTIVNSE
jgi:dihydroorotase